MFPLGKSTNNISALLERYRFLGWTNTALVRRNKQATCFLLWIVQFFDNQKGEETRLEYKKIISKETLSTFLGHFYF